MASNPYDDLVSDLRELDRRRAADHAARGDNAARVRANQRELAKAFAVQERQERRRAAKKRQAEQDAALDRLAAQATALIKSLAVTRRKYPLPAESAVRRQAQRDAA